MTGPTPPAPTTTEPPPLATVVDWARLFPDTPIPSGLDGKLLDATATIRGFCQWHIYPNVEQTLTVNGSGTPNLVLPTLWLTDVIDLAELQTDNTWSAVWDADTLAGWLDWSASGVLERRTGCWSRRRRGVRVTVRHGYDTADDVIGVACDMAARALQSPGGLIRQQIAQVSVEPTQVAPNAAGGVHLMDHEKVKLARFVR